MELFSLSMLLAGGCRLDMRMVVSAPGRVCLFGEHMDWCGYYVIPAAIEMRVYVEASPLIGSMVQVHSFKPFQTHESFDLKDLKLNSASELRYVGSVLKAMLLEGIIPTDRALSLRFLRASDIRIDPDIVNVNERFDDLPVQKGLSSSAALCVAVAAAVSLITRLSSSAASSHLPRSPLVSSLAETIDRNVAEYANLAYVGERKILGVNCGQMDQYASAYGGVLFVDCRSEPAEVRRISVRGKVPLVIGDTQQAKKLHESWHGSENVSGNVRNCLWRV